MGIQILGIVDKLNELSDQLREFIISKAKTGPFEQPLFWIGAFCLGLVIFFFTYRALQKEK